MILSIKIFFFLISLGVLTQAKLYENGGESNILTRRKKAVVQTKFKFDLPVKYYIGPFLNYTSIYSAIKRIEEKTCIKFQQEFWYIKGTSGFNFKRSYVCHSPFGPKVGYNKHENYVLLSHKCEHNVGVIEILIGTMLGLVFEHNRPDRDYYVKINGNNIYRAHKKDFEKYNYSTVETYGLQYDFYSGLHIFPTNFSTGSRAVLERKNNFSIPGLEFGQAVGLSFNDHKLLFNRYCLWNSSLDLSSRKQCENQGYHDLRRWGKNKCICPNGFDGDHCEKPIMDPVACDCKGNNILNATYDVKTKKLSGKGRCSYFIKSKNLTGIRIVIVESRTPSSTICYPNKGHEIKYQWDKGTTGLTLCGGYSKISIVSENNFTVVVYNGIRDDSLLVFNYSQHDFITTTVSPSRATTTRSIVTTTPLPSTPSLPSFIPSTPSPTTTQSTTTTSTTTQSTTTTSTTTQSTSTTTKRKTTKKKKPKPKPKPCKKKPCKPKPKPNCTKKPKKKKWKHKIVIKID